MDLHITELVWDAHCVAARVERTFDSENASPHITLALDAKTKPVYSNSLLADSEAKTLEVDCVVRGKYFM